MEDSLSEVLNEPLSDPVDDINLRLAVAASDIAELRAEVARLDRELDESRRLNLRSAELLILVYEQVARASQPRVNVPEAATPMANMGMDAQVGLPLVRQ